MHTKESAKRVADQETQRARAALTVVMTGPNAKAMEEAAIGVRLQRLGQSDMPDAEQRGFSVVQSSPHDWLEWVPGARPPSLRLSRVDGNPHVEGVPAGRYVVVVGSLPTPESKHAALRESFELELASEDEGRAEWRVELGVVPRVSIVGEPSEPITSARIARADGTTESLHWNRAGLKPGSFSSGPSPFATGRSIATSPLRSGPYRIELLRGASVIHTHPFELALDGSAEIVVDVTGL